MIVCVCRRVNDKTLIEHAQAGRAFEEIQWELGVATQCGRCEGCARDLVARCGSARCDHNGASVNSRMAVAH